MTVHADGRLGRGSVASFLTLFLSALAVFVPILPAQVSKAELEARVRTLEHQNAEILRRLDKSESHNTNLETQMENMRLEYETESLEELVSRDVSALIDRYQDPVTWSELTKSGNPIQIYGFLRFDAYYQTARANSVITVAFVAPENGVAAGSNNDSFAMDVRFTRLGFDFDMGRIGAADVTGKLETDFANFPSGVPESRETPRIRLAWIDLNWGDVSLRLGQDWDVIAPLNPVVHAEFTLWYAGNLGDRRPQARFTWETGDPAGTRFKLQLAAGLTGAIDNRDLDTNPGPPRYTVNERDGFDSGHPHGQGRAGLGFPSWVAEKRAIVGLWGAIGRLATDREFGGDDSWTPWTVGLDWKLPLFGPVSWCGELWYGEALSDFRGTMAQCVNHVTGDVIRGWGGWTEVHWQVTDNLRVAIGGSIDDPDRSDLTGGVSGQDRDKNWTLFLSSKLHWGGGLVSGLDLIYWETQYKSAGGDKDLGNMVRINFWTALYF